MLRRVYLKWPWPHFYEFPQTLAMIVVAPDATPDGVLLFPLKAPDLTSLTEADAGIRSAKSGPIEATPFFRKTMMVTRLPQPLRRLAWAIGLNFGRQRGNYLGTLLVTSVAAFGGGEVEALGPQSFILSYDKVSDDGAIDVMIRWDHRITDAAFIGGELSRLEQILNNQVADEILALASAEPVRPARRSPSEWGWPPTDEDLTWTHSIRHRRSLRYRSRDRDRAGAGRRRRRTHRPRCRGAWNRRETRPRNWGSPRRPPFAT